MKYSGVIIGKIKPYTRVGQGFSKKKSTYYKSQARVAGDLFIDVVKQKAPLIAQSAENRLLLGRAPSDVLKHNEYPLIEAPYRFGLVVVCPPVKTGPNKGLPPGNAGDYDNFVKAILDAAQFAGVVENDSLQHYRGPCEMSMSKPSGPGWERLKKQKLIEGRIAPGVWLGTEWLFWWTIKQVEDPYGLEYP